MLAHTRRALGACLSRGAAASLWASRASFSLPSVAPPCGVGSGVEARRWASSPSSAIPTPGPGELGFLRQLPQLVPMEEFIGHAKKLAFKVNVGDSVQGARQRERRQTVQALHVFSHTLSQPLADIIAGYRSGLKHLHPFEKVVAESIISGRERSGKGSAKQLLGILSDLRGQTVVKIKDATMRGSKASSSAEAKNIYTQTVDEITALWETHAQTYDAMRALGKLLRTAPSVDALLPTVVLCGSPNVGKSSLVRAVSSGKPEVQNYPFTTRSTSVGHIADDIIGYPVCQVMDTPGLLARSQEEFNAMEKMTLASILHLPSIVIFVLDLTGLAGRQSSVGSQLQVMEYLRQEFPEREWLYIITKTDLPVAEEAIAAEAAGLLPENAIRISCETGEGVQNLKNEILAAVERNRKASKKVATTAGI